MKKLYAIVLAGCVVGWAHGQTTVTFRVDMNGQTVSPDGVHIAGNFQGWNPSGTPMTDADGDGVYEHTEVATEATH